MACRKDREYYLHGDSSTPTGQRGRRAFCFSLEPGRLELGKFDQGDDVLQVMADDFSDTSHNRVTADGGGEVREALGIHLVYCRDDFVHVWEGLSEGILVTELVSLTLHINNCE